MRVSSTAAIPPRRSCPNARFNSMRFIFGLLGSEVDEIAVVNQLANERVDLPQSKLWGTFEIATNEAVLMHSHFQEQPRRHPQPRRFRISWPARARPECGECRLLRVGY